MQYFCCEYSEKEIENTKYLKIKTQETLSTPLKSQLQTTSKSNTPINKYQNDKVSAFEIMKPSVRPRQQTAIIYRQRIGNDGIIRKQDRINKTEIKVSGLQRRKVLVQGRVIMERMDNRDMKEKKSQIIRIGQERLKEKQLQIRLEKNKNMSLKNIIQGLQPLKMEHKKLSLRNKRKDELVDQIKSRIEQLQINFGISH